MSKHPRPSEPEKTPAPGCNLVKSYEGVLINRESIFTAALAAAYEEFKTRDMSEMTTGQLLKLMLFISEHMSTLNIAPSEGITEEKDLSRIMMQMNENERLQITKLPKAQRITVEPIEAVVRGTDDGGSIEGSHSEIASVRPVLLTKSQDNEQGAEKGTT